MQFVSESEIDKAAEIIGSEDDFPIIVQDFKSRQPVLLAYLFSENFKLLTQGEREYMMFLTLIIWTACENTKPDIATVEQSLLEELEESNWEQFHKVNSRKFHERIDPFFKNYPQEDLLALVEDALVQDEDSEITNEGRDYIFIALKTIIDSLDAKGERVVKG
jgi:hypothetical protein